MEILEENKNKVWKMLFVFLIVFSVYFAVKIFSEIKKDSLLGQSSQLATISFSGHGEVNAVPDIASVYFTISKNAATIKDAQAGVATIEKSALDVLKAKGVADNDIKTADASAYPNYEYQNAICPQYAPTPISAPNSVSVSGSGGVSSPAIYCPPGKQVLKGYTASESITVKVRNTDSVGDLMQALGATGISNLSGPNFSIDNQDALKAQARKLAIDDAKTKAQVLAKDLGVSLGKISSFTDSGNSYPIMYANAMTSGAVAPKAAPAVIPAGQNTITSDVTITYEIR
jgi:uncharacterized protein YggE